MFLNAIKHWFGGSEKNSEIITGYADAVSWIKTYRKAGEYDTAIFASRELLLKVKSALHYYEEAAKKIAVLETSNIETIAKNAKAKAKKVDHLIASLYKRSNELNKIIKEIEDGKQKREQEKQLENEKIKFELALKEIQEFINKKEYAKALHHSKKLVSDFHSHKKAISMLTKAQKLYDKEKSKEEAEGGKKMKLDKMFKELGVEVEGLKNQKELNFFDRFRIFTTKLKIKSHEKREYIKRQKALRDIEQLLVRSGTINNVDDSLNNEEIFSIMNHGLTKDIEDFKINGYDFYGRIIGKDKIVGDTFGFYKEGTKIIFYFGDATGHGIQAGFTVSLLSKLFFDLTKKIKNFQDLFVAINNELKNKLKGKVFVTAVFFELDYTTNVLKYIGAGHDPMYLYRSNQDVTEKIIPGGLALGVRMINNASSIKLKTLDMNHSDVLLGYTDGIIEVRDASNDMFGLERLEKVFSKSAKIASLNPSKIYDDILKAANEFRGEVPFLDDVSFFLFSRNTQKDLISNKDELQAILKEMDVKKLDKEIKFKNKTKQEVMETIKREKYERDLKIRLHRLDRLYKLWEFLRLKQEIYIDFREGFAHEKMKFYLEKALENEQKSILKKQEEKLQRKYETLTELYKKWEYEIVIKEVIDVIFKNGKL